VLARSEEKVAGMGGFKKLGSRCGALPQEQGEKGRREGSGMRKYDRGVYSAF
jgi:hypothetical protein